MYSPSTPFSEYLQVEQIKYPELTIDVIETLKESLKDDQKLPPISDKMYLAFIHSCYFNAELAKKIIRKYYSFHFNLPEVFCDLDPLSDDMEQCYRCVCVSPMPFSNLDKRTRVLYLQFMDENPTLFDYVSVYKYLVMWMIHMLSIYGTCDEVIVVVNATGLSWRHIVKLPIGITAKVLKFLELALPIRLKGVHVLNSGTSAQMLLNMVARFSNPLVIEKITMHAVGSEDIFNHVPRDMLPAEVGGTGKSYSHNHDELYNSMIDNRDMYLEQNEILNNQMIYMNQQLFDENVSTIDT